MITGSQGQLGRCAVRRVGAAATDDLFAAYDRSKLDIGNFEQIRDTLSGIDAGSVDVLLNAAAYTAVDQCEQERELAFRINGAAPGVLAESCESLGCPASLRRAD